jgi:hypothetical protein
MKPQSLTVGELTFRWADDILTITTSERQYGLGKQEAAQLLAYLEERRAEMIDLPGWAQRAEEGLQALPKDAVDDLHE